MVGFARLLPFATAYTFVAVEFGKGISDAYLQLQIPVHAEDKGIAIAYTCACKPALIPVILQLGKVGTQEVKSSLDAAHIVFASMQVET